VLATDAPLLSLRLDSFCFPVVFPADPPASAAEDVRDPPAPVARFLRHVSEMGACVRARADGGDGA
jgi:hypothetical protein